MQYKRTHSKNQLMELNEQTCKGWVRGQEGNSWEELINTEQTSALEMGMNQRECIGGKKSYRLTHFLFCDAEHVNLKLSVIDLVRRLFNSTVSVDFEKACTNTEALNEESECPSSL